MKQDFDLAIVGSGFGGSLLAMVARRIGLSVVLLERGTHPRFAIGESTSPLMNLMIEQLAERYDLPRLLPLTSYGVWKRTYPEVTCGLKRGFTYFHHTAHRPFLPDDCHERQLMVAASPNNALADTHWLRADVDHFLVKEAMALGVDYRESARISHLEWESAGVRLHASAPEGNFAVSARFLFDASGPRGFLQRALDLPESQFEGYPRTRALYSHFSGVQRCDAMPEFSAGSPPYPMDDAALHHLFEGGWMWVLRFDNGVTSAGIAVEDWLAEELNLAEGEPAWHRFLARFPTVARQFAQAQPVQPFVYAPRLSYRSAVVQGERWALLPSAAAFVDPLFSTGMPLTLLGIERIGRSLETAWATPAFAENICSYGKITLEEADWTAQFIAACYAALPAFSRFSAFSMFYFAAASFSEMARRLEKPLVQRYLAADHPPFAGALRHCAQELIENRETLALLPDFEHQVASGIECINVAGLCDPDKRNWYGVDLEDVIRAAHKLGFTQEALRQIIQSAPWAMRS